jgi:hypothetical protein
MGQIQFLVQLHLREEVVVAPCHQQPTPVDRVAVELFQYLEQVELLIKVLRVVSD